MKRYLGILTLLICLVLSARAEYKVLDTDEFSGMVNGWTFHMSYNNVTEVAAAGDKVYGLANGAIFSVDVEDEEVRALNALTGMSSSGIGHIISDDAGRLLVAYSDGNIDIIRPDGDIVNIIDLKDKALTGVDKLLRDAYYYKGKMYMAMDFGVLVLDMAKCEFSSLYQPVDSAQPNLQSICIIGDTLYAASETLLYSSSMRDPQEDFAYWHTDERLQRSDIVMQTHFLTSVASHGWTYSVAGLEGIRAYKDDAYRLYLPNGPIVNSPYHMSFYGDKMLMVPGGRLAAQYMQTAYVMIYEGGEWRSIDHSQISEQGGGGWIRDFTSTAIDPFNPNHYFVSAYGQGLWEFLDDQVVHVYKPDNSPIKSAVPGNYDYIRTEGLCYDSKGYLWIANAGVEPAVLVMSPEKEWATFNMLANGTYLNMLTPGAIIEDNLRPNYKWVASCRGTVGIGLIDDNGTPLDTRDDKMIFRSTFTDGNGNQLLPERIIAMSQDRKGQLWVGTSEGLFMISPSVDFFNSNRVVRVIIKRDDGSDLGDYMLGTEVITAIAADGGNRLWIGTEGSGVYLMDVDLSVEYDTKAVYHFTADNSPLPSDNILSIAIQQSTGEVFLGTSGGLVSFRGDANEPQEDFSKVYAFPNPVRPGYEGLLTVTGLTENAAVTITDAAGRAVFKTEANGGMAVWDMRDPSGRKVSSGVYVILCNSQADDEEKQHAISKVLIMQAN